MLHAIQSAAARYSRFIEPLASCSIDYYFRVFVRVHESKTAVKQASTKTAMVYHCSGCKSFNLQPIGKPQTANGRFGPAVAPTVGDICKLCQRVYHVSSYDSFVVTKGDFVSLSMYSRLPVHFILNLFITTSFCVVFLTTCT